MAQSRDEGDVLHRGQHVFNFITLPAGSVGNSQIPAGAGISASKLQQQYAKTYSQDSDAAPAAHETVLHFVYGATGTLLEFTAGMVAVPTSDSVQIDLHKNGSTILSAPITVDSGETNFVPVDGTISNTAVIAGDVLEVIVTLTGTPDGTGLFAQLTFNEDAG